jgi:hypothetical protein
MVLDNTPETIITKQNKKRTKWICECISCKKKISVWSHNIKLNTSGCRECACKALHINNKTGYKEITGSFWSNILTRARLRKIHFNITIEYAWDIFILQNRKCIYSGRNLIMPPQENIKRKKHELNIASLDRIDSSLGYIEGNIQWLHKSVNCMKNSLSEFEFLTFIKEISGHIKI